MRRSFLILVLSTLMLISLFANGQDESINVQGQTTLRMWYHGAGNEVEREILMDVINDFNASQIKWQVVLEEFPQGAYNDSVTAAALANKLPDILDVDGPIMPNWVWAGYMAPLELTADAVKEFLPGTKGILNGKLYSIGLWDVAIAMFARRSILEKYEIRIPTLQKPWDEAEFNEVLIKLKASGEFEYVMDLGLAWTGEWYSYAFSPFLQSFGGDLVDRTTYKNVEGILNGSEAIKFGNWWQSLFDRKLVPGTSQDSADRETGFIDGKYALKWDSNGGCLKALKALGDDLLILPAPDFGKGPKIGAASWQFGVSSSSKNKDGANAFIEFAIKDKYLAEFSDGVGLIPATSTAASMSKNYTSGGPMEIFFELSHIQGTLRPVTPGYGVASLVFEKALSDIANGADVVDTLDAASDEIQADIDRNNGYGF